MTFFKLLIVIILFVSCGHFKSDMIYDTYFPGRVQANSEFEWYVVTTIRADSVSFKVYLMHGPTEKFYIGEVLPTKLWTVDMLPVKGFKGKIPGLDLTGNYKIYLKVWSKWFIDERIFDMEVRRDVEFKPLNPSNDWHLYPSIL